MLHAQAAAWWLRVWEHGYPSPPPGDVPAGPWVSRPVDPSGRPRPGIGVYSLTAEEARIHVSAEMRRTLVHVYDEDEGTRSRWAAAVVLFTPLRL